MINLGKPADEMPLPDKKRFSAMQFSTVKQGFLLCSRWTDIACQKASS
jgi:hypothetical protein